jgi:hypothetical protein
MRHFEFILDEGYPEAQAEFAQASGDQNAVANSIAAYRALVNKNQVQGNERNIDWWRKQGWENFKKFVAQKSQQPTKTQVKRQKVAGQSINLVDNANWLVVIPLDKDASCFHGKGSDWCTTKPTQPYFENYFYDKEVTLIYCLNKQTGGMWAIAAHHKMPDKIEMFNQQDRSMNAEQFQQETGMNPQELVTLALGEEHQPDVKNSRIAFQNSMRRTDVALDDLKTSITERVPEIEKELLFNKSGRYCADYLIKLIRGLNGVATTRELDRLKNFKKLPASTIPEGIIIPAAGEQVSLLKYIEDPSERVQLAAVSYDGFAIEYITNPSEKIQHAAIEENEEAIRYIDNPAPSLINDYPNMIRLTPDAALAPIIKQIGEYIVDYADSIVQDWEQNDDGYQQWQAEQAEELGYVDDDGNVDWDQVANDDSLQNYLEYNYELREFLDDAQEVASLSPKVVREYAAEFARDDNLSDPPMYLNELDKLYSYIIKDRVRGESASSDLADFAEDTLVVRTDNRDNWVVTTIAGNRGYR